MLFRKTLLSIATVGLLLFTACSDDDENSYSQSDFYGTWELTNSTSADFVECSSDKPQLEISAADIDFPGVDTSTGCDTGVSISINYEFNGSAFVVNFFGQNFNYKVVSYSDDEFTWEEPVDGATETYVRIN